MKPDAIVTDMLVHDCVNLYQTFVSISVVSYCKNYLNHTIWRTYFIAARLLAGLLGKISFLIVWLMKLTAA